MAAVALTLSDAAQFGWFNKPSSQSTTPAPKSRFSLGGLLSGGSEDAPVLNILKPVTGLLDIVGETVGRILNLLSGGLRYRPYKKMTTTPPPKMAIVITTPYKEMTTTPPRKVEIVIPPPKEPSTEVATETTPSEGPSTHKTEPEVPPSESTTTLPSEGPSTNTSAEVPTFESTTTTLPSEGSSTNKTEAKIPTTEPTTTLPSEGSSTNKIEAEVPTTEPTTTTQASITEKGKPENVDWRRLNCSSPVRFQAKCRGSFAFAVTAAIEAQVCFKMEKYTVLSPQNLIDCTTVSPFENSGCDGGALEPTFDYVVNVGINSEADYPYTASASKCNFKQDKLIGRLKDYMSIDEGDEETIEHVLNNVGPIAVGIDATHKSFTDYTEGIYYEPKCKSDIESLNHAVLLVGYGVEPDGKRYWIIRNSYGTEWGDKGYGKIARDPKNHCGITTYVVYPVVF